MQLLGGPLPSLALGFLGALPGCSIELAILVRRKPGTVADLCRRAIRLRHIWQVRQPPVAYSCLQHLAQRDDFLVHGTQRRRPSQRPVLSAVNAVILHLAGRDLGQTQLPEKGQQVITQPALVILDVARTALALGDHFVLPHKLVSRLPKGLLVFEEAIALLAAQAQVPILGKLLRKCQAFMLGRRPSVSAFEVGRTLPIGRVLSLIEMNFSAHDRVRGHNTPRL